MIRQGWETNQQDDDPVEDASVSSKAAVRAQQRVLDAVAAAQNTFSSSSGLFFLFFPVNIILSALIWLHRKNIPGLLQW